jgi:hypothetical protein
MSIRQLDKQKPLDIPEVGSGDRQTQIPGYTRGGIMLEKHRPLDIPEMGSGVILTQNFGYSRGGIRC